jgi:hypothetical protein
MLRGTAEFERVSHRGGHRLDVVAVRVLHEDEAPVQGGDVLEELGALDGVGPRLDVSSLNGARDLIEDLILAWMRRDPCVGDCDRAMEVTAFRITPGSRTSAATTSTSNGASSRRSNVQRPWSGGGGSTSHSSDNR